MRAPRPGCVSVSPALNNRGLFASGTPVDVDVTLRSDGLVESLRALLAGLLTPGGAPMRRRTWLPPWSRWSPSSPSSRWGWARWSSGGDSSQRPATPSARSVLRRPPGWTPVARQAPADVDARGRAAARRPRARPAPIRVDGDLAPPTNRWYSGMFLGAEPQPVFAMPLAVQADDTGVAVGLPRVSASERTITAPFAPELRLGLAADAFTATRADPVSVTSTYTSSGTPVGELDLAEGWPYVGYTALDDQDVTVPAGTRVARRRSVAGHGGRRHDVRPRGRPRRRQPPRRRAHRRRGRAGPRGDPAGRSPPAQDRTLAELARGAVPVHGTSTSYDARAGDRPAPGSTTDTPGGRSTVLAAMPHQRLDRPTVVGRVDSLYGPLRLVRSRAAGLQRAGPAAGRDPGPRPASTAGARAEVREQVVADVAREVSGTPPRQDTYFGGKDVHRMAQLTRLAEAVGADDAARTIRERAVSELDAWLGGHADCAASVDPVLRLRHRLEGRGGPDRVVRLRGVQRPPLPLRLLPRRGGAAGRGASRELLDRWRPTLTALAEDIASPATNGTLPALRSFDPYAAHSWAAGRSDFADGNNQESSSEAINAWNGLARGPRPTATARSPGRPPGSSASRPPPRGRTGCSRGTCPAAYDHSIVSLNWGGKREWATWFSAEPSAMLGIQLLPMPPVLAQGRVDEERVRASVAEASAGGFDTMFGDYLTMYLALADPQRALEVGRRLPGLGDRRRQHPQPPAGVAAHGPRGGLKAAAPGSGPLPVVLRGGTVPARGRADGHRAAGPRSLLLV